MGEAEIRRLPRVEPRSSRRMEEEEVHRQCDIFLAVLTILAVVGHLCYEWIAHDTDSAGIPRLEPEPEEVPVAVAVPVMSADPAPGIVTGSSKIMERLVRAEAA